MLYKYIFLKLMYNICVYVCLVLNKQSIAFDLYHSGPDLFNFRNFLLKKTLTEVC